VKIDHLHLERYGIFTDRKLTFQPHAGLHVVLGPNEAGKTSALSAIGDLLFGFGQKTDYDFLHETSQLRVGGAFRHSDGRIVTARRRKGRTNTLLDENDQPLPDDTLSTLLDGISREAFDREFGLTAQALRTGGNELLRAGGRLAETLAAGSAGMIALSNARNILQSQADEIFTSRKSAGKPFYIALDRRDAAEKALRDAIVTREALKSAETALAESRDALDTLNKSHAESGVISARWQRTLRVRSLLAKLENIDDELRALADISEVPAPTVAEWQTAIEADTDAARKISALDVTEVAEAAEIAALAVDERLLAQGTTIDSLRDRLGAVRKDIEDLPRRRQARDTAKAALDEAARQLGLNSHAILLEKQPSELALAQARDLIDRMKQVSKDVAGAEAKRIRAQRELDEFTAEDRKIDGDLDPATLKQRLEALGDIPAASERLRQSQAAYAVETNALTDTAAALTPSPGHLKALRSVPVPDRETIATFAKATESSELEARRLGEAIKAIDVAIRAAEAELSQLSATGLMPTNVDLSKARQERDRHLDSLEVALDGDQVERSARFGSVVRSSKSIDGITDLLLTDTGRAALQENTQRRLTELVADRERQEAKLTELQSARAQLDAAWNQSWTAAGIVPHSPAQMVRWRDRFDLITDRLTKRDSQRAEIDALAASIDGAKAALIAFLTALGSSFSPELTPEMLFREARARVDQLSTEWNEAKARAMAKQRIARDLKEAEAERDIASDLLAELRLAWPTAMARIGSPAEATTAEAEAALGIWTSVPLPKLSFEREGRSVDTMEADLSEFEADVADLVRQISPAMVGMPGQAAVSELFKKLSEARRASDACERLKRAAEVRAVTRSELLAQRRAAAVTLNAASRAVGLSDESMLPDFVESLFARQRLQSERTNLHRDLHEIGDGHDEAALRLEREGLDLDQLPGEIEREAVRQKQLIQEIEEASACHHQAKLQLETLTKGRDAAAAAVQRAEASAELLGVAETWLLKAAASRLASRAIERHRAKVQDPVIARAGDLFATATDGAFTGLGISYGDDDQPELVARRRSEGKAVKIAGLSEGTRDQLFLALRIALIERRATEPMPFIGDDLLTSFDERRTSAALRLLAAAGERHQVIVFTHHRHVADLADALERKDVSRIDL
jgi:chromosome segregation protein